MKLDPVDAGQWVQPKRNGFLLGCCDCGLVHTVNFRLVKRKQRGYKIQFQAFRNSKATKLVRQADKRKKNKKLK